jgi:hypothetical protein
MFDVIIVGGISYDKSGRPLGPYRLRTAAENSGYALKVVDYAWAFDESKMLNLLSSLISAKTKVLGISASWFDRHPDGSANSWATQSFFDNFKKMHPDVTIVTGGTKVHIVPLLFNNSDWFITGFSDIAFIQLLNYLFDKDKNINLKYWKNSNVKVIQADTYYKVSNMDELETSFKAEDNFLEYQPMPLEVSRGCIFKCAFCTHPFLGKKSYDYVRSAESLARELARNYELFGTYRYTISDDTFNDSYEKLDIVKKAIDIAKLSKFEFVGYIRPELLVTKVDMIPKLVSLGLKGAHLGIESMNNQARKTIGKGMDINRVLEVVEQLRTNNVRLHSSFIAGLPHEPAEEIYQTNDFLIANRHRYFHSWNFSALGLAKSSSGESYSLFEKDPELYGFKTSEVANSNSNWLDWTNNLGMTKEQAIKIAADCNQKSSDYTQFAGWSLAQAWFHNIPSDQIINQTIKSTKINSLIKKNGNERAELNYSQIVNVLT